MQSRVCIWCHGDCYFLVPVLEAWLNRCSLMLATLHAWSQSSFIIPSTHLFTSDEFHSLPVCSICSCSWRLRSSLQLAADSWFVFFSNSRTRIFLCRCLWFILVQQHVQLYLQAHLQPACPIHGWINHPDWRGLIKRNQWPSTFFFYCSISACLCNVLC